MSTAALAGNPVAEIVRGLPMGAVAGAVRTHVAAAVGPTARRMTPLETMIELTNARNRMARIDAVPPPQVVRRGHLPAAIEPDPRGNS